MSEQWHHETETGRWTANALRLFPTDLEPWQHPIPRGYVRMRGSKAWAVVRKIAGDDPRPWHARLDGFEFRTTPGVGAARLGIKFTPVLGFRTPKEAMAAIDEAIRTRPEPPRS